MSLQERNCTYKFKSTLAHQKFPNLFTVEFWFHRTLEPCLPSLCAARTCVYAPVMSTRINILSKHHFLVRCLEKAEPCGKFHPCHRLLGGLTSQGAIEKCWSSMPTSFGLGRTIQWHKEIPILPLCSYQVPGRDFGCPTSSHPGMVCGEENRLLTLRRCKPSSLLLIMFSLSLLFLLVQ